MEASESWRVAEIKLVSANCLKLILQTTVGLGCKDIQELITAYVESPRIGATTVQMIDCFT